MKDFVISTMEASFNINYTVRISNILADIVQTFLCLDRSDNNIINQTREWLLSSIAKDENDCGIINGVCNELMNRMAFSLDHYSREEFYPLFRDFSERLIKEVVRKNSTFASGAYIERLNNEAQTIQAMNSLALQTSSTNEG